MSAFDGVRRVVFAHAHPDDEAITTGGAIAALTARGWRFYTFIGAGGARFMCSWDTEEARVRQLAADIREVMSA